MDVLPMEDALVALGATTETLYGNIVKSRSIFPTCGTGVGGFVGGDVGAFIAAFLAPSCLAPFVGFNLVWTEMRTRIHFFNSGMRIVNRRHLFLPSQRIGENRLQF